jgi:hypothetical protein
MTCLESREKMFIEFLSKIQVELLDFGGLFNRNIYFSILKECCGCRSVLIWKSVGMMVGLRFLILLPMSIKTV